MNRTRVPERTVRPRKPATNADRPLVIVIDDKWCSEEGEIGETSDLIRELRHMPLVTVVTAVESAEFLKAIQDHWKRSPTFNFRVSPVEREIFTGKQHGRRMTLSLTSVSWFGWKGEKTGRNNSIRNRYHLLIDPLTFSNNWLDERTFAAYLKWAQDIRAFCLEQKWNLRPTQGSVARQALQDPRFYPDTRRKVPRSTNEKVRPHLPGNHYQLAVPADPSAEFSGDYLDQTRCHHNHALTVRLPDSNTLYGYGHFRNPERQRVWRKDRNRVRSFVEGFSGLLYGHIYWPIRKRQNTRFLPKFLQNYGTEKQPANQPVYFYSEDIQLFESLEIEIVSLVAAWGSKKLDTGIAKYAQFALDELEKNAPTWKKTLLLSPYGALATTARKQTVAYHQSAKGKRRVLRTKKGTQLEVSYHTASKVSEPSTNNVLHRALIEASNRTETLLFARQLETDGYRVLCIYVDAVIIEASDVPPPLCHPWRHDQHLTHLRFISDSQFVSAELEKLPGLTGQQRRLASFGQLKGARRLGTPAEQRIRAYTAWQEDRIPASVQALRPFCR